MPRTVGLKRKCFVALVAPGRRMVDDLADSASFDLTLDLESKTDEGWGFCWRRGLLLVIRGWSLDKDSSRALRTFGGGLLLQQRSGRLDCMLLCFPLGTYGIFMHEKCYLLSVHCSLCAWFGGRWSARSDFPGRKLTPCTQNQYDVALCFA